ncbi:undecaprenyl-diphosphatase [Candidatus Dojkabacteria bacterium]|nr:undecaprenyl-diphosphatase [Candidatus Dojkabacteria bacterium]
MTWYQSIILGIVQGITEFLPISSSAHLVVIPEILGWEAHSTSFDIILHAGTLVAILIFFWKDIRNIILNLSEKNNWKLVLNILITAIPAGIIGFLFKDFIDSYFKSISSISIMLILLGVIMLFIKDKKIKKRIETLSLFDSLYIGIGQILSLIRGTSRSGVTIISGKLVGLDLKQSAKYSFLAGIPLLVGVCAYQLLDFYSQGFGQTSPSNLLLGFLSSLLSGLIAIQFLMKILEKWGLKGFGAYRIILGLLLFILN